MRRTDGRTHGRAALSGAFWVVLLCACATVRLCAQTLDTVPKPRVSSTVRYGKWLALGGAVALGVRANARHQEAEDTYQALRDRCFAIPSACSQFPDGHYIDPVSERMYAQTRTLDREASRYLIGAEVSFALAAAGFIWELMHREDRTPNIPFEPRVEAGATSTRIGLSVRF